MEPQGVGKVPIVCFPSSVGGVWFISSVLAYLYEETIQPSHPLSSLSSEPKFRHFFLLVTHPSSW